MTNLWFLNTDDWWIYTLLVAALFAAAFSGWKLRRVIKEKRGLPPEEDQRCTALQRDFDALKILYKEVSCGLGLASVEKELAQEKLAGFGLLRDMWQDRADRCERCNGTGVEHGAIDEVLHDKSDPSFACSDCEFERQMVFLFNDVLKDPV